MSDCFKLFMENVELPPEEALRRSQEELKLIEDENKKEEKRFKKYIIIFLIIGILISIWKGFWIGLAVFFLFILYLFSKDK